MLKVGSKVLLISLVFAISMPQAPCSDSGKNNLSKTKHLSPAEKELNRAITGRADEQLKHYAEAIRLDPKNERVYMARANHWFNRQVPAEAVKDYSSVLSLNPKNYIARSFRASCYASLQQWPLALVDYTKQIELSPGSMTGYRNRSYVYRRLGRNDLAAKDLAKLKDLQDDRAVGIYHTTKTPADYIEYYTEYLKKDPKSRSTYVNRAIYCKQLQRYAAAITDYTKALSLDPDKSTRHINYNMDQIYYDRANCYENLHQYEKAISDYGQILKMDEDAEEAFLYRGECYFKIGQYEKAVTDYTQSIKHDIDHLPKPYLCRAKAYEKLGKLDLAKADNEKAKILGPSQKQ